MSFNPFASTSVLVSAVESRPGSALVHPVAVRRTNDARPRVVHARYDAALTNGENVRHWALADSLSARAANSPYVRQTLRNRSRYECANNSYARGAAKSLANDTVGTGPRLQMLTDDDTLNERLEMEFNEWALEIGLADKLWTMRHAKCVDGESFGMLTTNPAITGPVQLDLTLIEADQIATPTYAAPGVANVDGMKLDQYNNVLEYHVLNAHPGDAVPMPWTFRRVPARYVLHWFRGDRPGQYRGVPEITAALPLFAQLRRYTLAVLAAAETAADYAAVVYSDLPPDDNDPIEPFDVFEIERRMMTTLPQGWKMGQFDAKQPATTYAEFKREILTEIGQCINMPYNIIAGNSSGYNFSSGRLDHLKYYKAIHVDQFQLKRRVLDRLFLAWLDEFSRVANFLPGGPDMVGGWPHQWFFDGHLAIDPEKEARAAETNLKNNRTTLADEWARRGEDYRKKLKQRGRERALEIEYGIVPAASAAVPVPVSNSKGEDDGGEYED